MFPLYVFNFSKDKLKIGAIHKISPIVSLVRSRVTSLIFIDRLLLSLSALLSLLSLLSLTALLSFFVLLSLAFSVSVSITVLHKLSFRKGL